MKDEIVYEFKKNTSLKQLNIMIDSKNLGKVKWLMWSGLTGVIIYCALILFFSPPLWSLLLMPIPFLLVYYGNHLQNRYLGAGLRGNGIESFTIELSIKKFNKEELYKITKQAGYTTLESILLLQSQIDKEALRNNKKFDFQSVLPISIVITLFLYVISSLTKELKWDYQEAINFMVLSISVITIYFSIQRIGNSIFDWIHKSPYKSLTKISSLLGDIALDIALMNKEQRNDA
jgi:hypothetical protein